MKIHYHCEVCGAEIAEIDVPYDEAKLGFDCLTSEERRDIISKDSKEDILHVRTLCDACMAETALAPDEDEQMTFIYAGKQMIH